MDSLKIQSEEQLSSKFTEDDIPTINVDSDKKTLRSNFKTINSILRQGDSHLKLECLSRINDSVFMFKIDPKQVMTYEKVVIRTKVLGKYPSVLIILIYLGSQISICVSRPLC